MSETSGTERDEALRWALEIGERRIAGEPVGDDGVARNDVDDALKVLTRRLRGEGDGGREEKQIQMEMLRRAYHSVMAAYLDREDYQKVLRGVQEGRTRAATHYHRRFSTPPPTDRSSAGKPPACPECGAPMRSVDDRDDWWTCERGHARVATMRLGPSTDRSGAKTRRTRREGEDE